MNTNNQYAGWRALSIGATAILAVAAGTAVAADDGGAYYKDGQDRVWKDPDGNCWHSPKGQHEARAECGDQVAEATPLDSDGDGVIDANDQCPGTPRGTEVDARGCPIEKAEPIVLKGVTFEFDKSRLTSQAENRLDNVVNALQASADVDFRIDGYTDSIGSDTYNQGLSQRRVNSVRSYLITHGISSRRITGTEGHGESDPVASNDTAAGRAQNRRVELHVTNQGDSMSDDGMMEQ